MKRLRIVCIVLALTLIAYVQTSAQSETRYDIEFCCICLVDSIASDTITQFWRFTHANNPGEYLVDVTYDYSSAYTPRGTLLSCKDYYAPKDAQTLAFDTTSAVLSISGGNTVDLDGIFARGQGTAGTLPIWSTWNTLGNSSLTESGTVIASSLTGAWRPPIGTNAQEPVWAEGMMRYDTDDDAFEGYSNSSGSEFFFAEAATENLTGGSVMYADANGRLTQNNSRFFFSGSEFRVNQASDAGNYPVQIGNASGDAGVYVRQGPIHLVEGNYTFGAFSTSISATAVSQPAAWLNIKNTEGTAGYGARIEGIQGALMVELTSGSVAPLAIKANPGTTETTAGINFTTQESPSDGPISVNSYGVGGGTGLKWTNYKALPAAAKNVETGRIRNIIANWENSNDNSDTQLEFWTLVNGVLTKTFQIDSAGLTASLYGSGTKTGTAAYYPAFTSGGKIIEKTAATVVDEGRPRAYAEMYIDDADPDTITFAGGGTTPAEGTDWTAGDLINFTYSGGRLTYTGTETAKFLVNTSISFSFSEGSVNVEGWVYKDGGEITGSEFHRKIGTGGDIGNAGSVCIVELATNAYIELFFAPEAHSGDDNIIISNANCSIIKL